MKTNLHPQPGLKITPKLETLLGEVCQSVKAFDTALDGVSFLAMFRFKESANFHHHDQALPDVTVGELMHWIYSFACEEGETLASQDAGATLIKARARQLGGMLKPIVKRINELSENPGYRNHQPFLFTALAHPRVCWALNDLYQKMSILADR